MLPEREAASFACIAASLFCVIHCHRRLRGFY
jgi:hypothetical protein